MMILKKLLLIVFVISSLRLSAQTQDSYDYDSEFTWGINKNSYGGLIGGFTFKKARKLANRNILETYGLEIMNVKNPEEVRYPSTRTGNYFIYGKTNYLYALRLQYGRDFIFFKKAPQQGVEIKAVLAAGPSIGIVAPYYIERAVDNSRFVSVTEPFDASKATTTQSFDKILGTGNLLQGIGDSKIQMGGNLKMALNFELGTIKSQVTGFEVGFLLDAYFNKIILMPSAPNNSVFPTIFFTLFYGSRK
jgi:hypothetical protein